MAVESIFIPAQASAAEVCAAMAAAVARALGWTLDNEGARVWKPVEEGAGSIGFGFSAISSSIRPQVCNGSDSKDSSSAAVSYSSSAAYCVDIFRSGNEKVTALGIRRSDGTPLVNYIIACNQKGVYTGFVLGSHLDYVRQGSGAGQISVTCNRGTNYAGALLPFPDICETGGSVFDSLYIVMSLPVSATNITIYVGGREYQIFCLSSSSSPVLAAPV